MQKLKRAKIKKLNRDNYALNKDKKLFILCEDFENAVNVGHIFRLADAVHAEVLLVGKTPKPDNKFVQMTSEGFEDSVPWKYFSTISECIQKLKSDDIKIISIELAVKSTIYNMYTYPNNVCFILGNENEGVSEYALNNSDGYVYIPMFGRGYSLNVAMAASIICFDFKSR